LLEIEKEITELVLPTPPKLTLQSLMSFAMRPEWVFNYFTHKKFELSNVAKKTDKGTNIAKSVIEYINEQYDPAMNWKDAEYCVKKWNKPFALKGVMSVEDAKRAIDIGCTAIMVSNPWWKTARWLKISIRSS
jgi:L-lactate dehydrogenase (cytochrome)